MTILKAAEKTLRAVGRPLHSPEIVEYAVRRGWIIPMGKTPDHSVQAALWQDIHKNGTASKFVTVGPGRFQRRYWLRTGKGAGKRGAARPAR